MTSSVTRNPATGTTADTQEETERVWKQRINDAREDRRQLPYEPTWLSDLAFAAGQQYLVYDQRVRQMRHIGEVDPRFADRELYTADRINEQRQAQLGELSNEDDRPELLVAQSGDTAEEQAKELNSAVQHGWDHEWRARQALEQVDSLAMDMGTAAIRCRWDPTLGPVIANVPHHQGKPVLDMPRAYALADQGAALTFKDIHEGRTVWEPLSAFNLLTPPGVNHEDAFPWEIVVRPVLIEKVLEQYPDAQNLQLTEDKDIASVMGLSTAQIGRASGEPVSTRGRLKDHIWLYTAYERPSRKQPNGRVLVFATNSYKLVHVDAALPYKAPDGTPRSGIAYFHWWRLNDRFWGRSFIQPMKDPQRLINRRKTQVAEIIDRGMPKVFTTEGTLKHDPLGLPLENIEIAREASPPVFHPGVPAGAWMYEDINSLDNDLQHASTLSIVALGENPTNVGTYAQLALLNENEAGKRSRILLNRQRAIAQLVEDSVYDIRKYWPAAKTILVSGDDDTIAQQTFAKARIPDWFACKIAPGAPQPRSNAAEITKIDAIWAAAHSTGATAATPQMAERWTAWYADSLAAGEALDIPRPDPDLQAEMAHYENEQMLHGPTVPEPAEYDVYIVHDPIHMEAQDQARASGDTDAFERIQEHRDKHVQAATVTKTATIYADPADPAGGQAASLALDEAQALRENSMLIHGIPLNPEALQAAQGQLQKGINPETGAPVAMNPETGAVMDDLQGILMRAANKPQISDNLQVQLDRLARVMKADEFEGFPPDVRARFLDRFDQVRQLWLSIPLVPVEAKPVATTMNIRTDVGPSTAAAILHHSGVIEADPHLLASEVPLANLVSETVGQAGQPDQPDTGAAPTKKPAAKKPKPSGGQ